MAKARFQRLTRLLRAQDGATAVEYGLIAAAIAVALVISLTTLGTRIGNLFNLVGNYLTLN